MAIIETPRLLFRPLTLDDADDLLALYSDPDVMRFFDGVRSRQQVLDELEVCRRSYESLGFYLWATIRKLDGRFIGRCGLLPQTIEGREEVEVAYMLARSCWHQGLGTEAARAIRDHGFALLDCPRLISLIAPGNEASIRVAEKNGMRYRKDVTLNGYVDLMYAVDRTEWAGEAARGTGDVATGQGSAAHRVTWEFLPAPERGEEFLAAYGPDGAWVRLFQRAAGYIRTELHAVDETRGWFRTVDLWESEEAYRTFHARFADEYAALDAACSSLTLQERRVGEGSP